MRTLLNTYPKVNKDAELRSRPIFGGSGSGSDPSNILRLRLRLLAPAPGQFQKAINQKIKVIILFFLNEKK